MKKQLFILVLMILSACRNEGPSGTDYSALADTIRSETLRSWMAYRTYAWGHDELLPLSCSFHDWYAEPLGISPIDAYSTLKIMGLEKEAAEIERFVADSLSFDKDLFVKTFEVNIRILGGLLSMYDLSGNIKILDKAEDFGRRLLPAFSSKTGLPHYLVNLKTGEVRGDTINVAEGGTYLIEMGVLSYYTADPVYYRAARKAIRAIAARRSEIGLTGQDINIETGEWIDDISHIGACIDSYYEYLYKGWSLFGDSLLLDIWKSSLPAVNKYIAYDSDTFLWYGRVNRLNGQLTGSVITLWDAYWPALMILSGDTAHAVKNQLSWDHLWKLNGLEPMAYDFRRREILNPRYYLNPEIIESAYYLYYFTGEERFRKMAATYWKDIHRYCRTETAYTHVEDVISKERGDRLSTFFFAETMKYLYLAFSDQHPVDPGSCVFNTEAHPYRKAHFTPENINRYLFENR